MSLCNNRMQPTVAHAHPCTRIKNTSFSYKNKEHTDTLGGKFYQAKYVAVLKSAPDAQPFLPTLCSVSSNAHLPMSPPLSTGEFVVMRP